MQKVEFAGNQPFTLYISCRDAKLLRMLNRLLQQFAICADEVLPDIISLSCKQSALKELASKLCEEFSAGQRRDFACHVSQEEDVPSVSQLMHTCNLDTLSEWIDTQWLQQYLCINRLTTFFQPIVDNEQPDRVFGYECLLRGLDEDGQVVPPLPLLVAAKKSGDLSQLDQLAMLTAIENASQSGIEGCVFINFSPQHLIFDHNGFRQLIGTALNSGLPPEQFVFEITESDDLESVDLLLDILVELRNSGFRIALDDVGAGYNSLSRLADIKPDFVKIDIELIRGAHEDPFKGCVTRKLIELSKELGCKTVAEGIETHDEWRWARDEGADYAQGFFFARPAAIPPLPSIVPFANGESFREQQSAVNLP